MPKRRRTSVVVGHTILMGPDGKPLVDERGMVRRKPIIKYPSVADGKGAGKRLSAKVDELKRIHGAGGPGALAYIVFADYARNWLRGKAGEVTEGTYSAYQAEIERHLIPGLGNRQVQSILQSDIRLVLSKLHCSINYRNEIIARAKSIFRQAVIDRIRPDNPMDGIKNRADKEPKRRALAIREKAAALSLLRKEPQSIEALMVALNYYTSCRRGEVLGLQWKHLDFRNRQIKICQQLKYVPGHGLQITPELKSEQSRRTMPMPRRLYEHLLPLRGHPDAYLFQGKDGRPMQRYDVEMLLQSIREKCPELSGLTPHYYRHNYATEMHMMGLPVKIAARRMGETVTTMLEVYTHIEDEGAVFEDMKEYRIFDDEEYRDFPSVAKSLQSENP